MKVIFRMILIYLLFLTETAIARPVLDLVLLGVVVLSLHDSAIDALIIGIWAGLLLGLVNPINFGFHITFITIIAFAVNSIRRFIYKYKAYYLSIVFLSLLFKYLMSLIFLRGSHNFLAWLLSIVIVLILAVPLEILIDKIFYPSSMFQRE
jgi:hypothetical protein